MSLETELHRIRTAIPGGQFVNEAAVSTGIVLPVLQQLGWPVFDPQVVAPEFSVEGRRVDYALCHPRTKPAIFVEVKQGGKGDGADRQLFEYAFHLGVPQAVLTDGQQWHFYLPAGQGNYQDRRVYKLDLVERTVDECARRLERYLAYGSVKSGAALKASQDDYQDLRKAREVTAVIPAAWRKLIQEEDDLLVGLLSEEVENLCGYKPEPDEVARFLHSQLGKTSAEPTMAPRLPLPSAASPARARRAGTAGTANGFGYVLRGERTITRNARDTLVTFFRALSRSDSTFLERFAALPKHGRRRRYVARRKEDLYPDRPDLAAEHSEELEPGWWIGTNNSAKSIRNIMTMAAEIVGIRLGRDLSILLGD
jgi:hypothetical protein